MKIVLASPAEPSGASWLVNCFLELGIKVCHKPVVDNVWRHTPSSPDRMWQQIATGEHRLHPRADVLRQFLPVLARVQAFRFIEGVEVEYVQEPPQPRHAGCPALLFVRDPRDSMYSMYRRTQPSLDYPSFLRFPDPDTLQDRPTTWARFVEQWLGSTNGISFTFEEYKRDAAGLLRRVLEHLTITRTADEIASAAAESSFEKARAAEEDYRRRSTGDWAIVNRAGRVREWNDDTEGRRASAFIESRAGRAMQRLGYDGGPGEPQDRGVADTAELAGFADAVDEEVLRASRLPAHRIRQLLFNLEATARERGWPSVDRLRALNGRFADGSAHQLAQVRDMLARRKKAPAADA